MTQKSIFFSIDFFSIAEMHGVVIFFFVQKMLLKRNYFKNVSDTQLMYVLKVIRNFFCLY